jgi:hypothetical protein
VVDVDAVGEVEVDPTTSACAGMTPATSKPDTSAAMLGVRRNANNLRPPERELSWDNAPVLVEPPRLVRAREMSRTG